MQKDGPMDHCKATAEVKSEVNKFNAPIKRFALPVPCPAACCRVMQVNSCKASVAGIPKICNVGLWIARAQPKINSRILESELRSDW